MWKRISRFSRRLLPLAVLLPVCWGCDSRSPLVPVEGIITIEGRLIEHGSISFRPDNSRGNAGQEHPTGAISSGGRYTLYVRDRAGAPAGWYRVVIFVNERIPEDENRRHPRMPKSIIDRRYNWPDRTPLSVEVTPEAPPGSYDFDIAPAR